MFEANDRAQPGANGLAAFRAVRRHSDLLCAALSPEDQVVQSMEDASPAKWHRAHTTWFFEQFVLKPHLPDYAVHDEAFGFLYNSYYEAVGARHPRPQRGLVTRPSADAVGRYRTHVDAGMERLLAGPPVSGPVPELVALGLNHEQQHQELLLTDMMHAFAQSPLCPAVLPGWREPRGGGASRWLEGRAGITGIGHGGHGFAFDNEAPRHQELLQPHRIASRLVTNAEWLGFIEDGGYRQVGLWMSEGWDAVGRGGWEAPLYWRGGPDGWSQVGLGGLAALDLPAPVRHVSWYEADAFARWSGARLPTEAELEAAAGSIAEFTGHVWQWTGSAYRPYPGFRAAPGAVGEYNGKFMINTMVLRGGSFATPPGHTRPSYRNFFHPDKRWQITGLRLAQDL